jgi:hypothetical protein
LKKLIIILTLLASNFILAQADMNDQAEIYSARGGLVKKTKSALLEVVHQKERTSIYITGHDHKNITDKKLSLSAIALVKGREYPIELSYENDHYSANPANSYLHKEKNFVLMLTITLPTGKEKAQFDIANK